MIGSPYRASRPLKMVAVRKRSQVTLGCMWNPRASGHSRHLRVEGRGEGYEKPTWAW